MLIPQAPASSALTIRSGRGDEGRGHTGRLRSRRVRHSAHGQCWRNSSRSKRLVVPSAQVSVTPRSRSTSINTGTRVFDIGSSLAVALLFSTYHSADARKATDTRVGTPSDKSREVAAVDARNSTTRLASTCVRGRGIAQLGEEIPRLARGRRPSEDHVVGAPTSLLNDLDLAQVQREREGGALCFTARLTRGPYDIAGWAVTPDRLGTAHDPHRTDS